jgi:PAS domain S-box-containing protein
MGKSDFPGTGTFMVSELSDIILESIDIGVFVVDDDFNVLLWNRFMETYTGVTKTEILGRNLFNYFSHLKNTGWPKRYAKVLDDGEPVVVDGTTAMIVPKVVPTKKKSSSGVFHNINLFPLMAGKDEVRGVLTVLDDVTERKELEDRFQNIMEYASDAIFILNTDGIFTYVNHRALINTALGKEDFIGKFFTDIVDPKSFDSVASAFSNLLTGEEVRGLYCTIADGRGGHIELEINAVPIYGPEGREVTSIQGIARDVTEKKVLEEEMTQLNEMAQSMLAAIPSGVAIVDRHLTLFSVNESFCHLFLTTGRDAIGRNLVDFLPADFFEEEGSEERILEVLDKIREGKTYRKIGVRHRNAKGAWVLDFKFVPLPGRNGRALLLIEDVTERERLKEQEHEKIRLETEIEKLRELDELKSEFISVASHELRTPLTGILIYLERLSDGKYCDVTEGHLTKIEAVKAQITLLAKIVDEMLETSRLEAGIEALKLEKASMGDVVSRSITKISSLAESKFTNIEVDIPDDLPEVDMDPDRIERVITNLLSNAINYSPRDTRILVEARVQDDDIVVRVIDEGPGIPDDHKSRIFERFYVIDKSLTRMTGGVGLGLAIAKGIIDNHGGRIWVEDGRPSGSVLVFTIPIKREG